jgi:hypothetical protein
MLINKKHLKHVSSGWQGYKQGGLKDGEIVWDNEFIIDASKGEFKVAHKTIKERRQDRKNRKQTKTPA